MGDIAFVDEYAHQLTKLGLQNTWHEAHRAGDVEDHADGEGRRVLGAVAALSHDAIVGSSGRARGRRRFGARNRRR